jgi:hypothetical protein
MSASISSKVQVFDQRMNALAGADGEMMFALEANLQILVQLLVEHHGPAFRAFGPKPFGNLALLGLGGELGLLVE